MQAKQCVRLAIAYFREEFSHIDCLRQRVGKLFKALRMFCPLKVASLNLIPDSIDNLRILPALDHEETIRLLKTELPIYLMAAREAGPVDDETQLHRWKKQTHLPMWQLAAKAVLSLLPSLASAERVFSPLKAHTSHLQTQTLDGTDATIQPGPLHSMISGESEFLCGAQSNEALFRLSFDEV